MQNLSFAKDMASWSQHAEQSKKLVKDEAIIVPRKELNLTPTLTKLEELIYEATELYSEYPQKEIGDARIHLAMAIHLLKQIK